MILFQIKGVNIFMNKLKIETALMWAKSSIEEHVIWILQGIKATFERNGIEEIAMNIGNQYRSK